MSGDQATAALLLNGAIVFLVGMLAGLPYGVIRGRKNSPEAEANWRVAHTQNLQNGLLCSPHRNRTNIRTRPNEFDRLAFLVSLLDASCRQERKRYR